MPVAMLCMCSFAVPLYVAVRCATSPAELQSTASTCDHVHRQLASHNDHFHELQPNDKTDHSHLIVSWPFESLSFMIGAPHPDPGQFLVISLIASLDDLSCSAILRLCAEFP